MLREREKQITLSVRLVDLLVGLASFALAYTLRKWLSPEWDVQLNELGWLAVVALLIHVVTYPTLGFYQSLRLKHYSALISMVIKATAIDLFILGAFVFFLQAKETSRYFFALYLAINGGLLVVEKIAAKALMGALRKRGYNFRNILLVGSGQNAEAVNSQIQLHADWGYRVLGYLLGPKDTVSHRLQIPQLGGMNDLPNLVTQQVVDEVVFCSDYWHANDISDQVKMCESLGIPARFAFGMFELERSKSTLIHLGPVPVIAFYTTLLTPFEAAAKRALDIVTSVIGLLISALLFPWIAYRIQKESPGPIFFKQVRVGENGRSFKCYKFRSMRIDADELKSQLLANNEMDGPMFKIKDDPRVFPFGSFLRKSSLDELPQFLNVLRGEMSVVGTRPPTPDEVRQYKLDDRRRLSIKPGITGLWQVSGRNQVSNFQDVVALDLQYIDQWSLWLDLRIMARTVWTLFSKKGAS